MVTKFAILSRGPRLWNTHTDKILKTTNSLPLFKAKIKDRVMKLKTISSIVNEVIKGSFKPLCFFFTRKFYKHKKHKNAYKRTKTRKATFLCV